MDVQLRVSGSFRYTLCIFFPLSLTHQPFNNTRETCVADLHATCCSRRCVPAPRQIPPNKKQS